MSMFPNDDAWHRFAQERLQSSHADPSPIAKLIDSGEFSTTQLNEIIARSIRDPNLGYSALGNDSPGFMFPPDSQSGSGQSVGERVIHDQNIIAPALDRAFRDGAVEAADLKSLGETYGQERVAALLGRTATGPGGASEAYAMALLEPYRPLPTDNNFDAAPTDPESLRAQGLAFSILANDPALRDKHFSQDGGIPPRYALETLVNYNDQNPYNPGDPTLVSDQSAQGLKAATNIYSAYDTQLLDHYTGIGGGSKEDMPELARFWAQTSINPHARDIEVPVPPPGSGTQPLYEAVNGTTHAYTDTLIGNLGTMTSGGTAQQDVVGQLAALQAGMSVATDLELSRYQNDVGEQQKIAGWFAETGGQLAGSIPGANLPVLGDALERGGKGAGGWVGGLFAGEEPVAPSAADGKSVTGGIYARIGEAEKARPDADLPNRPDLQGDFQSQSHDFTTEFLGAIERRTGHPVTSVFSTPEAGKESHASLLSSPDHPDYSRYATCLDACAAGNLGLDRGQLANVAATVALKSRAEGLPSLDHVIPSPRGDTIFAVAGKLDDPAHLRIAVPVEEARGRSVESSSRDWEQTARDRPTELAQETVRTQQASRVA
jgi:hypothetical protein